MAERVSVEVQGRRMGLSNLDKVLYPDAGFTKAQVIDYYQRIAPTLLPHLAGRPATRKRYPNGVEAASFFEKNAPKHTPDWVRTVNLPTPGSTKDRETIDYIVVQDLPTLVWLANLAALELHVPQWTVGPRGAVRDADLLVLDLDPGPPATSVECAQVALILRDHLRDDGLEPVVKTSGSKGLQVYAPIRPTPSDRVADYAKKLAQRLENDHPDLIVHRMTKVLRPGKVLIDWSQNNAAKTTVAPYSLRARAEPTVSTPVSWDEIDDATSPEQLVFHSDDVLDRVVKHGDLFVSLVDGSPRPRLP